MSATAALTLIRSAIEGHMADLILSVGIDHIRANFRDMFSATYEVCCTASFAVFPPRDRAEHQRDCRHCVPLLAIREIESALRAESLMSAHLREPLLVALELLRRRINGEPLMPVINQYQDDTVVDLFELLHDELVRRALRRSATWDTGKAPDLSELAAVHLERFQRFKDEQAPTPERPLGYYINHLMVARSADVQPVNLRRYLRGQHGPDSELTRRIEAVFASEHPLLNTVGLPEKRVPEKVPARRVPRRKASSPPIVISA